MGKLTKAELRAQLEAALANYKGPVTHCPPGTPPNEDAEQRGQRKFDRALREIAQLSGSRRADNPASYRSAADRTSHAFGVRGRGLPEANSDLPLRFSSTEG
jgi:hypothetical protein